MSCAFRDAQIGRPIEKDSRYSTSTEVFLKFLNDAKEQINEEYFPLVLSDEIPCIGETRNSIAFSRLIYFNYLIDKKNISIYGAKEKYSVFVENCRRVARNVLKALRVRLRFDGRYLKDATGDYKNFLEYLVESADNDEAIGNL